MVKLLVWRKTEGEAFLYSVIEEGGGHGRVEHRDGYRGCEGARRARRGVQGIIVSLWDEVAQRMGQWFGWATCVSVGSVRSTSSSWVAWCDD